MSSNEKDLRFARYQEAFNRNALDTLHFGSFMNAVLEYVFTVPLEQRGFVEQIVYYDYVYFGLKGDQGSFVDRLARVHVMKNSERYFFYVVAETHTSLLAGWHIVGQSSFLQGAIRAPDFKTEMTWM